MAPATPDARGREAVSLADAVCRVADAAQWPHVNACSHLAELVAAGRLTVVALESGARAAQGEDYVWREAVEAQEAVRVDPFRFDCRDIPGKPVPMDRPAVAAKPAIVGRLGVVEMLKQMGAKDLGTAVARDGLMSPAHRMGLLLDEVEAVVPDQGDVATSPVVQAPGAANAPDAVRCKVEVGKPVPGLPSDADLEMELRDERRKQKKGATLRLAEKYGCSVDTIQRHVKKAASARKVASWLGAKAA
ncbi:MAG: hypothetical protein QM788_13395 [Roseateles sp.]|uniref:hypothetical protein n=1 Tax=Roseateles sp. TaxID=1971397 RepID=UPI0039ED74A1